MVSLANTVESRISESDYLDGERISEIKHEYIDGVVYAMAGASTKHNVISRNILTEFSNHLKQKKSSCYTFSSDMKVKISDVSTRFFYPDVMVVCDINNDNDYFQNSPVIIVEVLSKSTRKNDFTIKMMSYFNIPTLEEYVLIEQDICQVQVYRKKDHWQSTTYFPGDEINFVSIDAPISVEDIYYQVNNSDMESYLKKKMEEE